MGSFKITPRFDVTGIVGVIVSVIYVAHSVKRFRQVQYSITVGRYCLISSHCYCLGFGLIVPAEPPKLPIIEEER